MSWLSVRMTTRIVSHFLFVNSLTSCLRVGSREVMASTLRSFLSPASRTLAPGCLPCSRPRVDTRNSDSLPLQVDFFLGGGLKIKQQMKLDIFPVGFLGCTSAKQTFQRLWNCYIQFCQVEEFYTKRGCCNTRCKGSSTLYGRPKVAGLQKFAKFPAGESVLFFMRYILRGL